MSEYFYTKKDPLYCVVIGGSHIDYSDGVSETEKINLIICVYYLNGRTARINGQSFLFLRH